MKIDFDIAIIGCGAYGMPLAAKLKKTGKQAIHLGGETQLLFGIKGKWWEENYPSKIASCFNEYWGYPADSENLKMQVQLKWDAIGNRGKNNETRCE